MKIIKVEFKIRYSGESSCKIIESEVEIESDSDDIEMKQQIKDYYYREIVKPEDKKISQTYPWKILEN